MHFILSSALSFIIHWIAHVEVTPAEVTRVKDLVQELEGKAIDGAIKRQEVAELVKKVAGDVSDQVIDWLILTLRMLNKASA
jgi:hypothetical protein